MTHDCKKYDYCCDPTYKKCAYCLNAKPLKDFERFDTMQFDTCRVCSLIINKLRELVNNKDNGKLTDGEFKSHRADLLVKIGRF